MTSEPSSNAAFSPIAWGETLRLLDQTLLPGEETWIDCHQLEQVCDAIRRLAVRGAPAIGVSAAYGLVVGLTELADEQNFETQFDEIYRRLEETRPTAVNLRWALEKGRGVFDRHKHEGLAATRKVLLEWAHEVHARDIETNRTLGHHGATVFEPGDRVLTHCNAGALATGGFGTAVGVITAGFETGKVEGVWVDETRPLLQGARLTAWELDRLGIPFHLVTDSSVGALMSRNLVDRVVVGADRIAANGDTANKIGTYTVAVMAARHGVPFYVAAPLSTVDPRTPTGNEIPIEERAEEEITSFHGVEVSPADAPAKNFAFDVTPHELIAGIITEAGVLRPPYVESLGKALKEAGEA